MKTTVIPHKSFHQPYYHMPDSQLQCTLLGRLLPKEQGLSQGILLLVQYSSKQSSHHFSSKQ